MVRFGVIVDGDAEYRSLHYLWSAIASRSGHTYLNPIKADLQPTAPIPVQVRSLKKHVAVLSGRAVDRIVVLVDREERTDCCGKLANDLATALAATYPFQFTVVVKNRTFENWLIADIDALSQQRQRFVVSAAHRRRVEPNKADRVDALRLLKEAAKEGYSKVVDAERIMRRADVLRIAANSRSFRRYLRVLDYPTYRHQSRVP